MSLFNGWNFFKGISVNGFLFLLGLAFFWEMPSTQAQITNNPQGGGVSSSQLTLLKSELQKRGISEEEAKAYLLKKGIDVDKLSQAELVIRKEEIIDYMRDLEAEKKLKEPAKEKKLDVEDALEQFEIGELDTTKLTEEEMALLRPELEKKKLEMEEEKKKLEEMENRKYQIYGHSFFENKNLKLIATTDGAKAPDTYILAAGDEIRITIFGLSQADILLEVGKEGYIQPVSMPKIFVQGLSLGEARKLLRNRFSTFYRFNQDQFAVTLQKARTITVNIFGEVLKQGGITMSALNSAIHAIAAAGGVTELASVREIELIRGKTRKKLDLYAFLEDPGTQFEFSLQQNDILFIPVANKVVSIQGAIKRPMRYEVVGADGLQKVIKLAGGLLSNTSPDFVQIERFDNDSMALSEYSLMEVLEGKLAVSLKDGDTIRLRSATKLLENFIEVDGAVFYPGKYNLGNKPVLSLFLNKAQVRPEAMENFVFVERPQRDSTVRVFKVNTLLEPNFPLLPRDKIVLLEKSIFANLDSITVSGAVHQPVSKKLSYEDQLSLEDALLLAGGAKPNAAAFGYVFRNSWYQPGLFEYIRVNIKNPGDFTLRAGDQLYIYEQNNIVERGEIVLTGEVKEPLTLQFNNKLTIADLISMAGGITEKADLSKVDVFRLNYEEGIGSTFNKISLSLDSNYQIRTGSMAFQLEPYDQIAVRGLPFFRPERLVQITGEVKYPGFYSLKNELAYLTQVITDAGGLSPMADRNNAVLYRQLDSIGKIGINLSLALKNPQSPEYDPVIQAGDSISFNPYNNIVRIRLEGTRLGDQVARKLTSDTLLKISEFQTFNYSGRKSAYWYLKNTAGGFANRAIRSSVTLTFPDGRVEATRKFLFLRDYPTVEPGSLISLTRKPEKVVTEGKGLNLERVLSTTTQSVSTLLTLILLLRQI
jgi:protein involved in polysaccharide export with SLBB domain